MNRLVESPRHFCLLLAIVALALPLSLSAAIVTTDKSDYTPNSTVTITGSGFQPGELVSLQLDESPDTDGDSPRKWNVVADSNGSFTDSSFSTDNADVGVTFTLTATGQSSGLSAQTTFTDAVPNLRVQKTNDAGGNATALGNNWTWTITVSNIGAGIASFANTNVILTDNLPNANIAYGPVTVTPVSGITGTIVCSINVTNDLSCTASGAVTIAATTGQFTVAFLATPSAIGAFANPRSGGTCAVDPNNVTGDTTPNNNTCSNTVTVTAPDLTVTKTNNVSNATTLGNSWTWTLSVANGGNATATFASGKTILQDMLPNGSINYGLTITVTPSAGVTGTGTISCSINVNNTLNCSASGGNVRIPAGESFTVSFTATPTDVGVFANPRSNGSCSVDPGANIVESDETNNNCSNTVTVTAPDLKVQKTNNAANPMLLGGNWTWTLTVKNTGTADANFANSNVVLIDNLPSANIGYGAATVTPVSGIAGTILCAIQSNDLTCTASGAVTIQANTGQFTVTFAATPTAIGIFNNPRAQGTCVVDPSSLVIESNENNNTCSDSVTVTAPDLTVSKTNNVNDATTLGNSWTWTFTVANGGNATATFGNNDNILTDNLPNSNISYGPITVTPVSGVSGGGTINCTINVNSNLVCKANGGQVKIGAPGSFTVAFSATPSSIGAFVNPRNACSVDPGGIIAESDETNNTCSNTVTVTAPDLKVQKTNNAAIPMLLGGNWTWTLAVKNTGNADANFASGKVILSDNLPNANMTYGSTTVTPVSGITGTITCAIVSSDLTCTATGPVTIASTTGQFTVAFTATPTAIGTFNNPRAQGACMVDPANVATESDETNNTCSDSVTVLAPDLKVSMTDNAGGAVALGNHWTWTLAVSNSGNAPASFNGTVILKDNLPTSNVTYGPVTEAPISGVSGTMNCSIVANDLTCTASGTVTIAVGGSFSVSFVASPTGVGTFTSPRSGGACAVDPDAHVVESNENNNTCTDTVVVSFDPDPIVFQTSYVTNLNAGDSFVNITNTGSSGGNLCVNVYAFDPSEELIACCSCLVTPNALVSLSAQGDLISNTLTPSTPSSLVIGLVATQGGGTLNTCDPTLGGAPGAAILAEGLRAWSTTLHALPGTPTRYGLTENDFQVSRFGLPQFEHLTTFCGFINANGSGFGICKTCRAGGLGGAKQ